MIEKQWLQAFKAMLESQRPKPSPQLAQIKYLNDYGSDENAGEDFVESKLYYELSVVMREVKPDYGRGLSEDLRNINVTVRRFRQKLKRSVATKTPFRLKMAGPSDPLPRQIACAVLIVLEILYLTKAGFGFDFGSNHNPSITNATSPGNGTVSYTVHTEQLTWNEARQKCIQDGGHLAVIDTYEKARLVGDVEPFDCNVWVGINRSSPSKPWTKAHDDSPVSNVPWAPNQPSGNHNCLTIQGCHRGLGNVDCAARKGYVCEKSEAQLSPFTAMFLRQACQLIMPPASTPENNCTCTATIPTRISEEKQNTSLPEGYASILNSSVAYKLYNDTRVSWMEAKRRCESEGARLAVADNKEINKRLVGTNPWAVHVGIHNPFDEWISLRDGSVLNNLPWKEGEPSGTYDCVGIFLHDGELKNYHCHKRRSHFACEVPIPPNTLRQ